MKTSELSGRALDWAVAKAAGYLEPLHPGEKPRVKLWPLGEIWIDRPAVCWDPLPDVYYQGEFRPTDTWDDAGPIIERERINTHTHPDGATWVASYHGAAFCADGPTALISAMRCFVLRRLGPEIDIPRELL